jgi:hypothetical protein
MKKKMRKKRRKYIQKNSKRQFRNDQFNAIELFQTLPMAHVGICSPARSRAVLSRIRIRIRLFVRDLLVMDIILPRCTDKKTIRFHDFHIPVQISFQILKFLSFAFWKPFWQTQPREFQIFIKYAPKLYIYFQMLPTQIGVQPRALHHLRKTYQCRWKILQIDTLDVNTLIAHFTNIFLQFIDSVAASL